MAALRDSGNQVHVCLPRALVLIVMSAANNVASELEWHPDVAARFWTQAQIDELHDVLAARLGPICTSNVEMLLSRDDLVLLRCLPSTFLEVVEEWEINARTARHRADFERAQQELDAVLGPLLDGPAGP